MEYFNKICNRNFSSSVSESIGQKAIMCGPCKYSESYSASYSLNAFERLSYNEKEHLLRVKWRHVELIPTS